MRNKPRIRFKGFTEDWEQRKLDELTIFIGDGLHGTPKYDENGSYYFINGNNLVDNKVSFTEETKKVAFEALSNDDRRLDSTAILMSINGTIGTLARYNNENIMLGKSVAYITPKNINRDFLFYQLQGNVIQSYFYKNLTGTTIKNLGLGTIKNTIVMSTLSEEESTIGRFFYKLDQYITLHQRKLEKLKLAKKALLQKLFPQNGSKFPELRFKGFADAWEQRKLNDFVTIRRGLTYKPSDIAEKGIRVLRSSNIDEDQFIKSNDDVFVNIDAVNIPFVKNGDILITSANGSSRLVGKHTIINDIVENSAVHGGFMLLAESNNPLFTDALLSSNWYKRFINTYVAGGNGAIGNLSKSDLESQSVMVPSEHEQTKIGQWYGSINQLITLHQRKLDKLQEVKKGLLQKIFV